MGFFYQKLHNPASGNRWQNQIEISHDHFVTSTKIILADTPNNNGPGPTLNPNNPIGDYAGPVTVGRNFYGIFSANNTPDRANFPNGVKYQRNVNFLTKTLLDLSGNPVPVSYDPFHYQIRWPEEECEPHEPREGHDIKYEAIELKGLRYEKLEIKELRFSFEDPRRGRHSHPYHHHGHEHEHDERGPCGG